MPDKFAIRKAKRASRESHDALNGKLRTSSLIPMKTDKLRVSSVSVELDPYNLEDTVQKSRRDNVIGFTSSKVIKLD